MSNQDDSNDSERTSSNDFAPDEDFGADGSASSRNDDGGFHNTVYSNGGDRFSWDTNADGSYKDGSAHHSNQ
jgi:hypothetical protein